MLLIENMLMAQAVDDEQFLYAWGDNSFTQSAPLAKTAILSWTTVAAGRNHSLAIRSDSKLYAWGQNNSGQTTGTDRSQTFSWTAVAAGYNHSLAIRSDSKLYAWGINSNGELGDGTATNKNSPVQIGSSNWTAISVGSNHSLAIRSDSKLYAWGSNQYGQLGFNNYGASESSPVQIGALNWTAVAAGRDHSLAVRSDSRLFAWGRNDHGQLGDGTSGYGTNKSSPVSVVGGFTDWTQISAGNYHTAAVRSNGSAWAWGSNTRPGYYGTDAGQLGDGTTVNKSSPVSVVGGFTDWVQISAGYEHTAAVRANGSAWAWGSNSNYYAVPVGKLGNGTGDNASSPVSVVGGFTDWFQISAGRDHTAALKTV